MRWKSTRMSLLLATALLAGGCGSAPERIDPRGVDGLVIPTPEVSAEDFDGSAQNPWFPLEPGSVRVYRHEGDTVATTTEVTVLDRPLEIAGLEAVGVQRVVRAGAEELIRTTSWYATDDEGNVWLLGEEVVSRVDGRERVQSSWIAGRDGASAGLAMPADPRLGDGFAMGSMRDSITARAEVVATDGAVVADGTGHDGVVTLLVVRDPETGSTELRHYAPGQGLVLVEQEGDAWARMELVGTPAP